MGYSLRTDTHRLVQWMVWDGNYTHNRNCTDHTICRTASPLAQYETVAATSTSDRQCATCPAGFRCNGYPNKTACTGTGASTRPYQDDTGRSECKTCASCPAGTP